MDLIREDIINVQNIRIERKNATAAILESITKDSNIQQVEMFQKKALYGLHFEVNQGKYNRAILYPIVSCPKTFLKDGAWMSSIKPRKVIVEVRPYVEDAFQGSSLRAIIVGNFIANLHSMLGHHVTRINHFGDVRRCSGNEVLEVRQCVTTKEFLPKHSSPMPQNAEHNSPVIQDLYTKLERLTTSTESNNSVNVKDVNKLLYKSVDDIQTSNARIGIKFDEYHSEINFTSESIKNVLNKMEQNDMLKVSPDCARVYESRPNHTMLITDANNNSSCLLKDVASLIDRYKHNKFDSIYYITDKSQTDYFKSLRNILNQLNFSWGSNINHVRLGQILGLTTTKGTPVLPNHVLDEAVQFIDQARQTNTDDKSYNYPIDNEENADAVVISRLLYSVLSYQTRSDFLFKWKIMSKADVYSGDTILNTYYRCNQVINNTGLEGKLLVDFDCLTELQAFNLVSELAKYEEAILLTYEDLEALHLVRYLTSLACRINRAIDALPIADIPINVAEARLLLFSAAKIVLENGMQIIGFKV